MQNEPKRSLNGAEITVVKRDIPMGKIYGMHRHDYIEIELITSGKAEHIYNSDIAELSCGDAYIVALNSLHAFRALTDTTVISIGIDAGILENELFNALTYSNENKFCGFFDGTEYEKISKKFLTAAEEHNSKKLLSSVYCKTLILEIIIEILRLANMSFSHSPTLSEKALKYVNENFKRDISLSVISEEFSVTPNYLGRLFSHEAGMSFNSYLNRIRISYVCNMLLFSNLTIKEIAYMAGYSSIEYFFCVFKKLMNVTPAEYRRINGRLLSNTNLS